MTTPEKMSDIESASESMREKIDVWVHEDNSVTIGLKGVNETFTRNEFGELVDRLTHFDYMISDAE